MEQYWFLTLHGVLCNKCVLIFVKWNFLAVLRHDKK